jgi:CHAT domain-containing protein/tetratricopeptide (TPR) repeat protein
MKRDLIRITAILGCLVILPIFDSWDASAYPQSLADQKILKDFYHLLESIQADSAAAQISALQDFLQDHPAFERVYHKLLERYLFYERRQEAKTYFQQLQSDPQYWRNSAWMLAKIFIIDYDPPAAFKAFSEALYAGAPSLFLLKDFIEFDHQQGGKFDGSALLRKLGLKPAIQKTVLAFYNYQQSEYARAIKVFSEVSKEISHHTLVLHIWGECFSRLARYTQADSLWRLGLASSRTNGDLEGEVQFLASLGILAGISQKYDEQLKIYNSAYVIASRIGDLFRIQLISGLRAISYSDRGNYVEAAKHYNHAISIASKLGVYRYLASWYSGYQRVLGFLGEFSAALEACDQSEKYTIKVNDVLQLVDSKIVKGEIYVYLKQYILAKKNFGQAYDLARNKNLTNDQQQIKVRLANVMFLEGKYAVAREIYQEVLKSQHQTNNLTELAFWTRRLGRTYELEGRYDLAKKEYLRALKIAQQAASETSEGWSRLFIGNTDVMLGNIDEAIKSYQRVYEIASKQKFVEMLWQAYLGSGNAYQKAGNLNAAIAVYRRAMDIIETTRRDLKVDQLRIGYFREGNQVYRNLAQCFLQRYAKHGSRADLDSLFYYDEMGRGRALQDLTIGKGTPAYGHEFLQARAKVRWMQHRLRLEADKLRPAEKWNQLHSELEAARYALLDQQLRVVKKDTSSAQSRYVAAASLPEIIEKLKHQNLGLLFYHISPETSFVLAVNGDNVKLAYLPVKPPTLRSAIDSLMTPFHHVNQDSVQYIPFRAKLAHQLYQWLVKPAEEKIALPPRLLVVPDLELANLPFEMLLTAAPAASDYTPADLPTYTDHFLLHRYTFVYSPCASLLFESAEPVAQNSEIIVFANPFQNMAPNQNKSVLRSFTGWRFDPLPHAEVEAQRIKAVQPQTKVRRREHAAKEAFLQEAPQYRIIHLATHAFVDTTFDAFSGLVLATGKDSTDDGMLLGYEISDLKLNCDLIALSACETGRGKVVAGEGVLGLPRLFLGAGAKSVLMTFWKVDDKFTSELMPVFYAHLLREKLPKADALNQAKRTMLGQKAKLGQAHYQHPFYWASFILFGDDGVIQQPAIFTSRVGIWLFIILTIAVLVVFLMANSNIQQLILQLVEGGKNVFKKSPTA